MDSVVPCVVSVGSVPAVDRVIATMDAAGVVAGLPAMETVVQACLLSSLWELSDCPYK